MVPEDSQWDYITEDIELRVWGAYEAVTDDDSPLQVIKLFVYRAVLRELFKNLEEGDNSIQPSSSGAWT